MSSAEQLRAKLGRLEGSARARPLLDLVQVLSDRYWRLGPGQPHALPVLDEAIAAIDEAYSYFGTGDALRPQVAAMSGWLHGIRHLAHLRPGEDRTIGIEQLEESLRNPDLPPMLAGMSRITLGQLYMATVAGILQSPDIASRIMWGDMPADATGDLDRATVCLEQVGRTPAMAHEAKEAARLLLRMVGAMRTIVTSAGGGSGVAAMNRIMDAMSVLQDIHREQSTLAAVGPVGGVQFYGADEMANLPPLDRPVPLIEADDRETTGTAARTRPSRPADVTQPAVLRRALRARISAGGDLFEALDALLDPAAPAPAAALIDDVVALATEVVDAGAAGRTDHLLLAVGLCLRAGAADARWARPDLDEATGSLLHAAASPRPAPPEVVRVMRRLATMADAVAPECRAREQLSVVLRRSNGKG